MTRKRLPSTGLSPSLPNGFADLLGEVKLRIQTAQARAMFSVNAELIRLYWDIGRMIEGRQQHEGWGAAVIPRLSTELHNELPEMKGFSERNIKRMLAFHREYPSPEEIVPQAVAQLAEGYTISSQAMAKTKRSEKGPQAVAQSAEGSLLWQIPWGHHIWLIEKVKDLAARRWYMQQSVLNGWSRNVLTRMIDSNAHRRTGQAVSNFEQQLPAPQSDLVQQTLKDPYIFDFLTLDEQFHERELEAELVRHLEKFLLELGQGFAFVGRQYRITVGEGDFYIDLLFYHLRLRAFVVIDLKTGPFQPEYAGKLNFYCNVVNDRLRHELDHPTIGLILCQTKDKVLAEYALSGIDKPIGVSSYELTRALPRDLRSALPTVQQIEAELSTSETAKESAGKRKITGKPAPKKKAAKKPKGKKRNDDYFPPPSSAGAIIHGKQPSERSRALSLFY